jgi:hypothetical protein
MELDQPECNYDVVPLCLVVVTCDQVKEIVERKPDSTNTNSCDVWLCDGFVVKRVKFEMQYSSEGEEPAISALDHFRQRLRYSSKLRKILSELGNGPVLAKLAVPWMYVLLVGEIPYLICERIDGPNPEDGDNPEWDEVNDAIFEMDDVSLLLPDRKDAFRTGNDGRFYCIDFGIPLVSFEIHNQHQAMCDIS